VIQDLGADLARARPAAGLFDARGHLLGITTFYFKAGQNLNFASPPRSSRRSATRP